MDRQDPDSTPLKIGAVARLTGVSVHTLRKWEDRYQAVTPTRTPGGERLYTRNDLKRLALIKRLSDTGLGLRDLASLTLEKLEATSKQLLGEASLSPPRAMAAIARVKLGVLGDALPALLQRQATHLDKAEICGSGDSLESLRHTLAGQSVDVLVLEFPTLGVDTRSTVQSLMREVRVEAAVIVYGFASQTSVNTLRRGNVALMRAPIDPGELQRTCLGLMYDLALTRGAPPAVGQTLVDEEIPPYRLSPAAIAAVAASTPKVRCECPHHLSDLVLGLRAFEDYSSACESQNPADAALHHYLWSIAARARVMFEDALVRVAEAEGIPLD